MCTAGCWMNRDREEEGCNEGMSGGGAVKERRKERRRKTNIAMKEGMKDGEIAAM